MHKTFLPPQKLCQQCQVHRAGIQWHFTPKKSTKQQSKEPTSPIKLDIEIPTTPAIQIGSEYGANTTKPSEQSKLDKYKITPDSLLYELNVTPELADTNIIKNAFLIDNDVTDSTQVTDLDVEGNNKIQKPLDGNESNYQEWDTSDVEATFFSASITLASIFSSDSETLASIKKRAKNALAIL